MSGIELVKFNDGKATKYWAFMDMQDMMKMMGPQPAMKGVDTTMKNSEKDYRKKSLIVARFFCAL